jgi:hypothetical protein
MASLHHGNREATTRLLPLGLATELMLFEERLRDRRSSGSAPAWGTYVHVSRAH